MQNKTKYVIGLLSLAVILTRYRQHTAHTIHYAFLYWNLFLAFIPVGTAFFIRWSHHKQQNIVGWCLLPIWLVFFPNAPYILSDLMHIYRPSPMPFWYDPIMLASAALSALYGGFLSVSWVQDFLRVRIPCQILQIGTLLLWPLTGMGIYLGRILRWDILSRPMMLLEDITSLFIHPKVHGEAWTLMIIYTLLLSLLYGLWKSPTQSTT